MKLPENLFSRTLLAWLPLMVYPYGLFKTAMAALWIVLFLWITVSFFWFTRRFFPERSLKYAFSLWLLVWAQAVWMLTQLPPLWILSVFFLMPVSFLEGTARAEHVSVFSRKVSRYFSERILSGVGFMVFAIMMTFIREAGEKSLELKIFEQPAGLLFVAAGLAFLWKSAFLHGKQ